jgi:hypothetical protein
MKTKSITIFEDEAQIIYSALRVSISGYRSLGAAHNYSDAEAHSVKVLQAEIFREFFKYFSPMEKEQKVKLPYSKWCAIYCALDRCYVGNSLEPENPLHIPYRDAISRIFKTINTPSI